ncbi:MAG TPA: oligosaccharide flippase family protein [Terriglobales bacterium]
MSAISNTDLTAVTTTKPHHKSLADVTNGMIGKMLIFGLNAVTGVITARVLHAAGRGEQSAMALWPAFLVNATSLGLPSSLTYHLRRVRDSGKQLVGTAFLIGFFVSILTTTVVYWAMPYMLSQYSPKVIFYARVFLLTMPVSTLMLLARSTFEGHQKFSISIVTQLCIPSVNVLGLTLLWLCHWLTPFTSAAVYAFNIFPITAWLGYRLIKLYSPEFPRTFRYFKDLMSYGIRALGIDLCITLSAYVDQAFVVKLLSPADMGAYVVALSASRILNFCQASVVMVLLPKAASLPAEEAIKLSARAARLSMLLTSMAAFVAVVFAPFALQLLYGNGFQQSVPVIRILLAEVTISGTVSVLAQAAMGMGRPGVIAILQGAGLGLLIPLLSVLVPRYGITGAAWALFTSTSIRMVLLLCSFPIVLKVPFPRIWPVWDDLMELVGYARTFFHQTFSAWLAPKTPPVPQALAVEE